MVKSLAGKADQTIVGAAYRAAMANVPVNNKDSIKMIRDAYKGTLDNIQTIFAGIQLKNDLQNKELTSLLKPINDKIQDGTFQSGVVDFTVDDLAMFREEWKNIPKGPDGEKERAKWKAKVNKYATSLGVESDILATNAAFISAGEHNVQATGGPTGENLWFLTELAKYHNKEESFITRSTQNGEIVYTANMNGNVIQKTQSDLKKLVTIKDFETRNGVQTLLNDQLTTGQTNGTNYDPVFLANRFDNLIMSSKDPENAFRDFIHSKHGSMKNTIAQEIHNPGGIYTEILYDALNNSGLAGTYDIDGGGISASDFQGKKGEENYLRLTTALTDVNDASFDFKLSKEVAGAILAAGEGKDAFDRGKSLFNASQALKAREKTEGRGTDTDNSKNYGGFLQFRVKTGGAGGTPVSITSVTATQRRGFLDNFQTIDGEHGNYDPIFDNNNNFLHYIRRDDEKIMTMFEVAKDEGLVRPGENKNDFNPGKVQKSNLENEYTSKGLASPSMLKDVGGDDDASSKLNANFGLTSDSDFYFMPYSSDIITAGSGDGDYFTKSMSDNIFTNDVMLIDNRGRLPKPVLLDKTTKNKYKLKDIKRFGTKDKYNKNDLDWINNFLKDYVVKTNINTDFED